MKKSPVFRALADPTRRAILDRLVDGSRSGSQLAEGADMSGPAVSQHLRVLREASLVTVEKVGRRWMYTLDAGAMSEVDNWLAKYRVFWSSKMDRLESSMASKQRNPSKKRTKDSAAEK